MSRAPKGRMTELFAQQPPGVRCARPQGHALRLGQGDRSGHDRGRHARPQHRAYLVHRRVRRQARCSCSPTSQQRRGVRAAIRTGTASSTRTRRRPRPRAARSTTCWSPKRCRCRAITFRSRPWRGSRRGRRLSRDPGVVERKKREESRWRVPGPARGGKVRSRPRTSARLEATRMTQADTEKFRLRHFVEKLVQQGECTVHDAPDRSDRRGRGARLQSQGGVVPQCRAGEGRAGRQRDGRPAPPGRRARYRRGGLPRRAAASGSRIHSRRSRCSRPKRRCTRSC